MDAYNLMKALWYETKKRSDNHYLCGIYKIRVNNSPLTLADLSEEELSQVKTLNLPKLNPFIIISLRDKRRIRLFETFLIDCNFTFILNEETATFIIPMSLRKLHDIYMEDQGKNVADKLEFLKDAISVEFLKQKVFDVKYDERDTEVLLDLIESAIYRFYTNISLKKGKVIYGLYSNEYNCLANQELTPDLLDVDRSIIEWARAKRPKAVVNVGGETVEKILDLDEVIFKKIIVGSKGGSFLVCEVGGMDAVISMDAVLSKNSFRKAIAKQTGMLVLGDIKNSEWSIVEQKIKEEAEIDKMSYNLLNDTIYQALCMIFIAENRAENKEDIRGVNYFEDDKGLYVSYDLLYSIFESISSEDMLMFRARLSSLGLEFTHHYVKIDKNEFGKLISDARAEAERRKASGRMVDVSSDDEMREKLEEIIKPDPPDAPEEVGSNVE